MAASSSLLLSDLYATPSSSTRSANKLKQQQTLAAEQNEDSEHEFYAEDIYSNSNSNNNNISKTKKTMPNEKTSYDSSNSEDVDQLKSKCLSFSHEIDNVNLYVS